MGTNFAPTNVSGGFNTDNSLNADLTAIQTALSRCLNVYGDSDAGDNQLRVDIDMNSQQLVNLAAPTSSTNAVTKAYGDANYGGTAKADAETAQAAAEAAQTAAEAAQTAAESAQTGAETAETNAETAETNAATSEAKAADWAEEAEDVEVETGQYSAFHWAQKAAAVSGGDTAAVSSNDTTPGYLNGKLVAGNGISLTEQSDGGNETLEVATTLRGCLLEKTTDQSMSDASATAVDWDAAVYDTDSLWSAGTPDRITVPAGVTKIRITAGVYWATSATGHRWANLQRGGASVPVGVASDLAPAAPAALGISTNNLTSAIFEVSATQYFYLDVWQDTGGPLDVKGGLERTWLQVEIVE